MVTYTGRRRADIMKGNIYKSHNGGEASSEQTYVDRPSFHPTPALDLTHALVSEREQIPPAAGSTSGGRTGPEEWRLLEQHQCWEVFGVLVLSADVHTCLSMQCVVLA